LEGSFAQLCIVCMWKLGEEEGKNNNNVAELIVHCLDQFYKVLSFSYHRVFLSVQGAFYCINLVLGTFVESTGGQWEFCRVFLGFQGKSRDLQEFRRVLSLGKISIFYGRMLYC
jgi:hypothetical protein